MKHMKQIGKSLVAVLLAIAMLVTLPVTEVSAKKKVHMLGNSVENQMLGSHSAEYKGRIYYGINNSIYSVKKDGTGRKKIYTMKEGNRFTRIAVYNGYIYALYDFSPDPSSARDKLVRIKLDGSKYKCLDYADTFAVADGKIYFTRKKPTGKKNDAALKTLGIYSMKLDGGSIKAIVKGSGLSLLSSDGKHIYYENKSNKTDRTSIYRCDMKGKSKKKLLTIKDYADCYAISKGYFFYALYNRDSEDTIQSKSVYKLNMKNGKKTKVYTEKTRQELQDFFVEGDSLYINNYGKGLKKIKLSTKKESILMKGIVCSIDGVYGNAMVCSKHKDNYTDDLNIQMYLMKKSTGEKIKKIGEYYTP